MERFNLETWFEDKSRKVIDDDGFPVEIIKWDANEKYPVVLLNHNGIAYNVSVDGMYDSDPNHGIFFADEELTEFEKELEKFRTHILTTSGEKYDKNGECVIKNISKKLLDLARKEFIPKKQYEEDLDKAYKNADKVQFNRGMDEVLTNPQKYFHVGDTIRLKNSNVEHTITSIFNGRYYGERWSLDILKAADDYELVEDCNEISKKIDYSSEIIGFLKNYIKAYGCTAMNSWVKWLEEQCHDGKKWIYEDKYIKDKEQTFKDGIDEVLENPQKYGLEKQGEQKPFDMIEPKFKAGDWVVYNRDDYSREIIQVYDIRDGRYYFTDNIHFSWSVKECDEKCHLWTIQDVKDGDVLKEASCVFIVEKMKSEETAIVHCCLFDDGDFSLGSTLSFDVDSTYPATKEQRNILFQKMKEEGYEWDTEKKELNKIEQKTWSEEDEKKIMWLVRLISTAGFRELDNDKMPCSRSELLEWLKSFKFNYWKPSDEQMEALFEAKLASINNREYFLGLLYEDLKKL